MSYGQWVFPDHEWEDSEIYEGILEKKGTTMTKTATTTKTTTAKKGTTAMTNDAKKEITMLNMPENFRKMNLAAKLTLHNEWMQVVMAADLTPTIGEVSNACPNKGVNNITDDPVELAFLPYVAAYFGWEDDEYCYESQAKECGGILKEGAQGWPICWVTKTTQSGPNMGKSSTFCQWIFPKSAFDWTYGDPKVDDDAIADKELDALIRATNRQIAKLHAMAKERGVKLQTSKTGRFSRVEDAKPAPTTAKKAGNTDVDAIVAAVLAAMKASA